jgi:tartrate-resistant acid phosphatase type 5
MRVSPYYLSVSFTLALAAPLGAQQVTTPASMPLAEQVLSRLPTEWRAAAAPYNIFDGAGDWVHTASDADLKSFVLQRLANEPGAQDFVLDHLSEPIAARAHRRLYESVAYGDLFLSHPRALTVLEHEAVSEPDPLLARAALDAVSVLEARRTRAALQVRWRAVEWDYEHHAAEVDSLERADEELSYEIAQIQLPAFALRPPPPFRVSTPDSHIRVLAFGDYGEPGEAETKTADAMAAYHHAHPFDFAVTVGDNFYFAMDSITDARWKTVWEDLYGRFKIPVYPTFGNHDWGGVMTAAELLYSYKSPDWHFPAPYYTFTAGPVQFFAINTEYPDQPSAAQLRWLRSALDSSHARWKLVYSHFPVFSSYGEDTLMASALMPVLAGRADIYLCGHLHTMQHHQPEQGVNLFIVGGGGAHLHTVNEHDPETIFAKAVHGFGVLEADDHSFTVRFIGDDGTVMHEATLRK